MTRPEGPPSSFSTALKTSRVASAPSPTKAVSSACSSQRSAHSWAAALLGAFRRRLKHVE